MVKNSFLYKIGNKTKLAKYLGITRKELLNLCNDNLYKVREELKHNGTGTRIIEAPAKQLKSIQRKLNKELQKLETPSYLFSGIKGKSFIDNALVHVQNKYVLCVDIHSFYPSTDDKKVLQFYKNSLKTPNDIAKVLTELTTFNGHLPTGAPTSVILAFFAYAKTFDDIYMKAQELKIDMSVYVDDVTFSSQNPIPISFYNFVEKRMKQQGLILKKKKTKWYKPGDFKIITGHGISAKNEGKVPIKNILKIKAIMQGKNIKELSYQELISLKGSLIVAQRIEPKFYNTLFKRICSLIKNISQ